MAAIVALLSIAGIVALAAIGVIWGGYVLVVLWGWFIAPQFGVLELSIPAAIGIALVVSYLTHPYQKRNSTDASGMDAFIHAMLHTTLKPMFALGIGWAVKQYI